LFWIVCVLMGLLGARPCLLIDTNLLEDLKVK